MTGDFVERRAEQLAEPRCDACWVLATTEEGLDPLQLGDDPEQRYKRLHELMHA